VSDSVEQNGYVQTGSPLVTIEDTSAVEVQCNLRMEELRWVLEQTASASLATNPQEAESDYQLPQTPVTVTYGLGNNEYQWQGTLTRYDGMGLDTRTRTVPVRVLVPNPRQGQLRTASKDSVAVVPGPRALVRGMFVKATIHVDPRRQLLRVPERALQPGNVVWRVRDNQLNIVPVRVALTMDDWVLLEGANLPLQPDDRVIVSPVAVAIDGMPVREETLQ
jgi:multidrug efflux pump subunit AcrA (membrane-fusion protein)